MTKQDILEKQASFSYIAIGCNLGDKLTNIEQAKNLLDNYNISVQDVSSYYETPSWPNRNFPNFFNIVVKIKTNLSLVDLFFAIKKIEKSFGRKKTQRNYPRKCDIDIIDFKGLYIRSAYMGQKIETPHPRMHKRNFVLFPLYELNKTWIHPKTNIKINNLISLLNNRDFSDIRIV